MQRRSRPPRPDVPVTRVDGQMRAQTNGLRSGLQRWPQRARVPGRRPVPIARGTRQQGGPTGGASTPAPETSTLSAGRIRWRGAHPPDHLPPRRPGRSRSRAGDVARPGGSRCRRGPGPVSADTLVPVDRGDGSRAGRSSCSGGAAGGQPSPASGSRRLSGSLRRSPLTGAPWRQASAVGAAAGVRVTCSSGVFSGDVPRQPICPRTAAASTIR